jgi:hypothetical protein
MDEYLEELERRYGCYNNKCKPNCRCNKCYYIGARGLMEPSGTTRSNSASKRGKCRAYR